MPQCAGCGKRVCPDEPKITLNKVWHKCCFRCNKCNCDLDTDFARVYKGEIYCHPCFKLFRRSRSFEGEDEAAVLEEQCEPYTSSSHNFGKTTAPPSEDCFPCKNRKKVCKGRASYALPRELANYFNRNPVGDRRVAPTADRCRPCSYPIYQGQAKTCRGVPRRRKYPATCVSRSSSCLDRAARSLSKRHEATDSCESLEKFQRQSYNFRTSSAEPKGGFQNRVRGDVSKSLKFTGCAPCRRCGHKVYAAEIVLTSYGAYHNSCYSCYSCLKPLDATSVEEHCGEIFCRRCYKKHFGVNNYGFRNRVF